MAQYPAIATHAAGANTGRFARSATVPSLAAGLTAAGWARLQENIADGGTRQVFAIHDGGGTTWAQVTFRGTTAAPANPDPTREDISAQVVTATGSVLLNYDQFNASTFGLRNQVPIGGWLWWLLTFAPDGAGFLAWAPESQLVAPVPAITVATFAGTNAHTRTPTEYRHAMNSFDAATTRLIADTCLEGLWDAPHSQAEALAQFLSPTPVIAPWAWYPRAAAASAVTDTINARNQTLTGSVTSVADGPTFADPPGAGGGRLRCRARARARARCW